MLKSEEELVFIWLLLLWHFQHISCEAAPVFVSPQDAGDERPDLIEVS